MNQFEGANKTTGHRNPHPKKKMGQDKKQWRQDIVCQNNMRVKGLHMNWLHVFMTRVYYMYS